MKHKNLTVVTFETPRPDDRDTVGNLASASLHSGTPVIWMSEEPDGSVNVLIDSEDIAELFALSEEFEDQIIHIRRVLVPSPFGWGENRIDIQRTSLGEWVLVDQHGVEL